LEKISIAFATTGLALGEIRSRCEDDRKSAAYWRAEQGWGGK
jgi:hypothetical protein